MQRTLITSALLLTLALAVTACQTPATATSGARDVCLIWTPLEFSATGDTAETVRELRDLNARRDAYCGQS